MGDILNGDLLRSEIARATEELVSHPEKDLVALELEALKGFLEIHRLVDLGEVKTSGIDVLQLGVGAGLYANPLRFIMGKPCEIAIVQSEVFEHETALYVAFSGKFGALAYTQGLRHNTAISYAASNIPFNAEARQVPVNGEDTIYHRVAKPMRIASGLKLRGAPVYVDLTKFDLERLHSLIKSFLHDRFQDNNGIHPNKEDVCTFLGLAGQRWFEPYL